MTQRQAAAVLLVLVLQPAVLGVAARHTAALLPFQQGLPWGRAGRVVSARRAGSSCSRGQATQLLRPLVAAKGLRLSAPSSTSSSSRCRRRSSSALLNSSKRRSTTTRALGSASLLLSAVQQQALLGRRLPAPLMRQTSSSSSSRVSKDTLPCWHPPPSGQRPLLQRLLQATQPAAAEQAAPSTLLLVGSQTGPAAEPR